MNTNLNLSVVESNPILQTAPHHKMSLRYGFVPTFQLIEGLKERGWEVTQTGAAHVRRPDKEGFQRHVVKMTSGAIKGLAVDFRPEIAIMNDHCGMGRIKAFIAMQVYACSNGLMTAEDVLGGFSFTHRANVLGRVIDGVYEVIDRVPQVVSRIKEFKEIALSRDEQEEFAMEAAKIRWGDKVPVYGGGLLMARRLEDRGASLWKTYNVVQENLIRGGNAAKTANGRLTRTRAVRSINKDAEINRGLWRLVEETANKLAA